MGKCGAGTLMCLRHYNICNHQAKRIRLPKSSGPVSLCPGIIWYALLRVRQTCLPYSPRGMTSNRYQASWRMSRLTIRPRIPPNVRFEIDDVEDDWLYHPNSFDFIHFRFLFLAIKNLPRALSQAMRYGPLIRFATTEGFVSLIGSQDFETRRLHRAL